MTHEGWEDADAFYALLVEHVDRLPGTEVEGFLARLVLALAHRVGDRAALEEAIAIAADRPSSAASD